MGEIIGYVRVSTAYQNAEWQQQAIQKHYKPTKWFTDHASGKNAKRPELEKMLAYVRSGDTVVINDYGRLARNTKDLMEIIEKFQKDGIKLISIKEGLDISTSTGQLMLKVMGAIWEFERENALENQRAGIEAAKEKGVYKNRVKPKKKFPEFPKYWEMYKRREVKTKKELCKLVGCSFPTLENLIKEQIEKEKTENSNNVMIHHNGEWQMHNDSELMNDDKYARGVDKILEKRGKTNES